MKKTCALLASLVAAFALATGLLAGCGSASSEGDSHTFAVGFDADFPPFGYLGDDGKYTGFDLELADEVCKRNGWTIEYEPISWDAKDALLDQGTISCIWNGFTMEGREGGYEFTEPYLENGQVVVVRADSDIRSLSDLAGKNVLTQTDSAGLKLVSAGGEWAELGESFARLDKVPDYNSAMMQLGQGSTDAVIIDVLVANFQLEGKEDQFRMLDERLSDEHYAVAFKLGDTELRDQVEQTLREMYADGTVEQIAAKYSIDMKSWLLK